MKNDVSEEEMRLAQKEYYRNYRLKNREKMRKAQQRFWRKKVLENREKPNKERSNYETD